MYVCVYLLYTDPAGRGVGGRFRGGGLDVGGGKVALHGWFCHLVALEPAVLSRCDNEAVPWAVGRRVRGGVGGGGRVVVVVVVEGDVVSSGWREMWFRAGRSLGRFIYLP